jgi:hypothetical protein
MSTIKVSTIDTPTASNFAIKTGSAPRLTILQSGNIGIGTASPLCNLHVSDLSAEIRITAPSIAGADWGILPQTNNSTPLFRIFDRYNSLDRLTISSAGLVNIPGTVNATSFTGNGTIPIGGIIMWSGAIIPTGWAFCDGTTVSGIVTPNLTNKFIISRSSGTVTTTTITGVATSTGGSKDAVVVEHTHTWSNWSNSDAGSGYFSVGSQGNEGSMPLMNPAGESGVNKNLPPYYALAFIMRVA